jgi:outer membrane scaffolding protein for murein synthesis (MipA/OmpV family)
MTKPLSATLTLFAALTATSVHSEDSSFWESISEPAYGLWSLGAVSRSSLFEGVETQVSPTALIFGGYGPVFIEGNRFGHNFYRDGTWFASAVGNVRNYMALSQEQIDDSDFLSQYDLDERKASLEAGVQLGRRFDGGWIGRVALLQDISNRHNAQEAELMACRRDSFKPFDSLGSVRLLSTIALQYQTQDLNDYYFGIDQNELALASQQAYEADDGWSAELEFIATYDFEWGQGAASWGEWAAYTGLRHYQFSDTIADSPIVETGLVQQYFVGLGKYF